jgi:hypothetical protein
MIRDPRVWRAARTEIDDDRGDRATASAAGRRGFHRIGIRWQLPGYLLGLYRDKAFETFEQAFLK